ncbi:hypothetical protein [Geodermatophilus sp. URMC 60]
MRSSLSTAGRRASVLAAAALVSLTTAACGPADLQIGAAGTAGQTGASSQTAIDRPLSLGDAAPAPSSAAPSPVPTPAVPEPTIPAQTQTQPQPKTQVPVAGSSESESEDVDEPAAATVPAEVAPGAPQAAATADPGRRKRGSSSGRSTSTPAAAPAPVAGAAAAPAAAGASTGGSGGAFTDQARRSFTAGNGQTGNYLLYAGGIDPAKPVGLVVYVDGTGEYGVDNPTTSYALGGSSGLVATSRARNMITLAVESPNQSCECWHTGNTSGYADFLAGLIENQLSKYPVSEVWLSGFSSGAQEITRFLVPRHPELMRLGGGWVVFGGGGPPADGGSAVTAARMAGVRGHWFTGTADTSVPLTASWGAQAGERFYAGRGVVTSSEYPAGVGHALDGRLGRTVGQLIDAS